MKEVFPNYYDKFQCVKDQCIHNCCIGWEIDIDEDTIDLYNFLDGEFADKIRNNIEGETPHFKLNESGRCPFLNESGLCDIITELGDDALCDICYLHPRFRNFYDDFIETGLGLCCEEAVRIVLTEKEKFSINLPYFAKKQEFFKEREAVFGILQNRESTMLERLTNLADKYGFRFEFSNEKLYELFMSLERLDADWENELEKLKNAECTKIFEREDLQIVFEQLACYFVFRHFENGVGFAILSCWVLGTIFSDCENMEKMFDVVRMYSSEIEYSEENFDKIIDFLDEKDF